MTMNIPINLKGKTSLKEKVPPQSVEPKKKLLKRVFPYKNLAWAVYMHVCVK